MNLDLGNLPRTIWVEKSEGGPVVGFVDQRLLPDDLALVRTADWREVVDAVKTLAVRGAPAIGVAGAAAVMLAAFECAADESAANLVRQGDPEAGGGFGREGARADFDRRLEEAARVITGARPTAVNLSWGVRRAVEAAQEARSAGKTAAEAAEALYGLAGALIAEDEAVNRRIGAHGAMLLREIAGGETPRRPPMASTALRAWPHLFGGRVSTSSRTATRAAWRRLSTARRSALFMRLRKKGLSTASMPTRRAR